MKRIRRASPRRAETGDDKIRARPAAAVDSAELRTQPNEHQTPAWVLRMRERGIDVREPRRGAVIEPFKAVRQAGPLLAFWRRAVRRLRESRAVP